MVKPIKPPKKNQPTSEPVTLQEARDYLRLDAFGSPAAHPDDELVEMMISAARGSAEEYINHSIAYREVTLQIDEFCGKGYVDLQDWPVVSIESVGYLDRNGDTQTLDPSEYILDDSHKPARLYPVTDFPSTQDRVNAVTITYMAGYTYNQTPDAFPFPKPIKLAILLNLGHLYENRQDVTYQQHHRLPMGSEYLLQPYRIIMGI